MSDAREPALSIVVERNAGRLTLSEAASDGRRLLLSANIVPGCGYSGTPEGTYVGGTWIKDKTNPAHGPVPWSTEPWRNPYGPYFLPLNDARTGRYTTYGIHGTRGPLAGNFEKPPVPQRLLAAVLGDNEARYLYCSHGCVRLSNQNIVKLFEITTQPRLARTRITITIK